MLSLLKVVKIRITLLQLIHQLKFLSKLFWHSCHLINMYSLQCINIHAYISTCRHVPYIYMCVSIFATKLSPLLCRESTILHWFKLCFCTSSLFPYNYTQIHTHTHMHIPLLASYFNIFRRQSVACVYIYECICRS